MRPWVMLKQAGIEFDEVKLRFDSFSADSNFKQRLGKISTAGKVPVLVDGDLIVWDSLAIAEYVAEKFAAKQLWPVSAAARARARSVCAEMHSGFTAVRGNFPMNIEASLPQIGALKMRDNAAVRGDVARIVEMWSELLDQHGGPLLFGNFTIADAYFAPVCMRFRTYQPALPAHIHTYVQRVAALPGVAAWISDALAEQDFLDFEEPYRLNA
jgi:glutathione S-transferase